MSGRRNTIDLPPAHIGVGRPPFGRLGLLAAAAGFLLLVFFGVRFLVRQDGLVTLEPTAVARREVPVDAISLAVLPFTNMSKDMANTRFGDGLADALITALSRVKSVAIASRTSAFQYREAIDLKKVGSNLGVRYVIDQLGGFDAVLAFGFVAHDRLPFLKIGGLLSRSGGASQMRGGPRLRDKALESPPLLAPTKR